MRKSGNTKDARRLCSLDSKILRSFSKRLVIFPSSDVLAAYDVKLDIFVYNSIDKAALRLLESS